MPRKDETNPASDGSVRVVGHYPEGTIEEMNDCVGSIRIILARIKEGMGDNYDRNITEISSNSRKIRSTKETV